MDAKALRDLLWPVGILPILVVEDVAGAVAAADRLVAAGMPALEILFRSPEAPAALAAIRARHPGLRLAAGTVLDGAGVDRALAAGADFLVSPALSPGLHAAVAANGALLVPGVNTATEVLVARDLGYGFQKLYPAFDHGAARLDEFARIYPEVGFLVTGHVQRATLAEFAVFPNVVALGGTWMVPETATPGLSADMAAIRAARAGRG